MTGIPTWLACLIAGMTAVGLEETTTMRSTFLATRVSTLAACLALSSSPLRITVVMPCFSASALNAASMAARNGMVVDASARPTVNFLPVPPLADDTPAELLPEQPVAVAATAAPANRIDAIRLPWPRCGRVAGIVLFLMCLTFLQVSGYAGRLSDECACVRFGGQWFVLRRSG